MSSYAKFMDVRIVAEGVESLEELQCLIDLNIEFAQGYYLGRPNIETINSDMSILKLITSLNKNKYTNDIDSLGYSFVGQIMEKRPVFMDEIKCKEVVDLFKHSKFESLCFMNKDDDIVGYINQNELFHNFSTQFGYSLYGDKPIKSIFNDSPLIVNYHFSIKQVLELAMSRPERNIYDDVIIANNGKYLGIASMRQIITKYNEIDNQHATQLNPLTSLPGNNIINNNINKYMQSDKPVHFTYVDLSDFKVYNDFYGFECGDIVLKKTADILVDRFECLPYDSFVGHIGGDDFVCMCEISIMGSKRLVIIRNMLDGIIDDFEKHKVNFYNEVDYKNGYIETANRLGKYGKCGLININLACYLGKLDCFETLEEIAEYMATIKRQSKQRNNSNYIIRYSKDNSLLDLSISY